MHHSERGLAIPLVGAPNSGKTTLFNWLTASKFRTVNYTLATVDYAIGASSTRFGEPLWIMDTPGTYSLHPKSPEEEVTYKVLFSESERLKELQIPVVIAVVDATQLHKHLYLVRQLTESGHRVIVAITMVDLLVDEAIEIDWEVLAKELKCPVVKIDGRLGGGVAELLDEVRTTLNKQGDSPLRTPQLTNWSQTEQEAVYHSIEHLLLKVRRQPKLPTSSGAFARTGQLDRILLHETWGLFFLILTMVLLFSSIFWLAAPLMDLVDQTFTWLAVGTSQLFGHNLFSDFLGNGLVAGVGSVLVFVPQILILFLGIGLLEDSGYLARAATLVDRPLSRIGLNGRAFVPILSGFACAVPAMLSARTISSRKERLITLFILPFLTCSARLPVYALLLSFLFIGDAPWKPGVALALIYILSLVLGATAAAILSRIIPQTEHPIFLLELPYYRRPQPRVILTNAYHRTLSYIKRAGPIIFFLSVIMWTLGTFPESQTPSPTQRLERSYLGQLGNHLDPLFKPIGVDWRVGISLLTAFAAREVFVSNLAVLLNVGTDGNEEGSGEPALGKGMILKMNEARDSSGDKLFTISSVVGLIVFFMIALQCTSTVAMAAKESGSWTFALTQLLIMNIMAYVFATACVQGLRSIGIA